MAAYDRDLAKRILAELDTIFPSFVSDPQLKASKFSSISYGEWQKAVDALKKLGHVRSSAHEQLIGGGIASIPGLEITTEGKAALEKPVTQSLYYWHLLQQFGFESKKRWLWSVILFLASAITSYFIFEDPDTAANVKHTIVGGLLGSTILIVFDLVRSPWLLHEKISDSESLERDFWSRLVGTVLAFALVAGVVFLAYETLSPRKHKHEIDPTEMQYGSMRNLLGAFRGLAVATPNCTVRITAPFENRRVEMVLRDFGAYYCKVEPQPDPSAPHDDVLRGAVNDGIVIHMAKDPQSRDTFVADMKNVFSAKRVYDLPSGLPPDLIWIQVGRGYVFRKDDGRNDIE